jgi:general secretion pathway protein C
MKQVISPKLFSTIIFFFSIVVLVKLIWIAVSLTFLPITGEEFSANTKAKALYFRVRLSNNSMVIAPIVKKVPKKAPVSSMRGIKLLALYNNSSNTVVVTVEKNRKTSVLGKGDTIDGFKLVSAGTDYALFKKSGKEFKLRLENTKTLGKKIEKNFRPAVSRVKEKHSSSNEKIIEKDGIKLVKRNLLTTYTSHPEKIWKDIGITENKRNGRLHGFKINYVKRGSDFEKLGLRRGDLLMAINAEKLDNLGAVMSLYKDINNIENLTLTVERNGKSEDIEYEIQ